MRAPRCCEGHGGAYLHTMASINPNPSYNLLNNRMGGYRAWRQARGILDARRPHHLCLSFILPASDAEITHYTQEGHRAWRRVRTKLVAEGLASVFLGAVDDKAASFLRLERPLDAPAALALGYPAQGPGAGSREPQEEDDGEAEDDEGEGGGGGGQIVAEYGFDWQVISLLLEAGAPPTCIGCRRLCQSTSMCRKT